MIVNFNPNVSSCKKQKTRFGNAQSANSVKGSIEQALKVSDPKLRMTVSKALDRIASALENEDREGKSILKKFRASLLGNG